MKRLPGLLVAFVVLTGCVEVILGPDQTSTTGPTASTATTSTLATATIPPSTTTLPSGPPVAWVAPSGVTLAVTGVDGETIEVLTPCGDQALLTQGTPIHDVDVVIDPGHGGPVDTGAVASTGLMEKVINLRVSLAVQEVLAERGVSSLLTRTGDYPVPIRIRSEYSDLSGASALVSIHHNAPEAPASETPGVEIFVQNQSPESARLGGLVYESTMATLSQFDVDWDRAPDAGVMTVLNSDGEDAYGMVRRPLAPSALVELGYIANTAEAELYADPAYVPAVSAAVADAIVSFLTSEASGSPLVEGRDFNPAPGVGSDQCIEPDLEASLYPDIVDVSVTASDTTYNFVVTMSAPYDGPKRFADAWRVIGDDGVVYGVLELLHDHATEQPFTRSLADIEIPNSVRSVTIEGRDQVYGWGGNTVEVSLP